VAAILAESEQEKVDSDNSYFEHDAEFSASGKSKSLF
jgi:hypothetical protein